MKRLNNISKIQEHEMGVSALVSEPLYPRTVLPVSMSCAEIVLTTEKWTSNKAVIKDRKQNLTVYNFRFP